MSFFARHGRDQRGASLVELTVVLPTVLMGTLAVWQSALLFHAKSHLNYAAFEAARAGSLGHASVESALRGLARGLVAYHGGGLTSAELAQRLAQVEADVRASARVEVLSPVIESFDDYQSPALRDRLGAEARVIPNVGIAFQRCPHDRPGCNADPAVNASGQTLQDANLLKLRITYGVPQAKQLPLVGRFITLALRTMGSGSGDAFQQALLAQGRIPLVSHVTLRMQSEPIEHAAMVSVRGGTPGQARPPGETPNPSDPPPGGGTPAPGPGGNPSQPGPGPAPGCPDVPAAPSSAVETVAADPTFEFGSSRLTAEGRQRLDQLLQGDHARRATSLALVGHTDPLGNAAANERLSLARARAVRDYLRSRGFDHVPITVRGAAAREPVIADGRCAGLAMQARIDCHAPDRRVSFAWQFADTQPASTSPD